MPRKRPPVPPFDFEQAETDLARLAQLGQSLQSLRDDLHHIASVRRLLAQQLSKTTDPDDARRLASELKRRLGLIATQLETVPQPKANQARGVVTDLVEALLPAVTERLVFRPGRRAGALDPLDRVLFEIVAADHWRMAAVAVLEKLRARAGTGVICTVSEGMVGRVPAGLRRAPRQNGRAKKLRASRPWRVLWRHPKTGAERVTAWTSIRARRLPRIRQLVRQSASSLVAQ